MVARMMDAVKRRSPDGRQLSFSLAIDATKVCSVLDISTAFKAIMGAPYPLHMISTVELKKGEIKDILDKSRYDSVAAQHKFRTNIRCDDRSHKHCNHHEEPRSDDF